MKIKKKTWMILNLLTLSTFSMFFAMHQVNDNWEKSHKSIRMRGSYKKNEADKTKKIVNSTYYK